VAGLPKTNVTFDVYRGFNAANPYSPPNRPAALKAVSGYLQHHVRNGRFGYVPSGDVAVHWTNVLLVPVGTDVRSAYNAELNAFAEAGGDTIMVADYPVPGTCCAFVAVMVQRRGRGTPGDHLRVYLDRAAPQYGQACPDPNATGTTSGCSLCAAAPLNWSLTVSGIGQAGTSYCPAGDCAKLNGTFTLKYRGGCNWTTDPFACGNPCWQLQYDSLRSLWRLNGASAFVWSLAPASFRCLAANTLSFDSGLTSSADCNNLPATLTVSPA
jgi:hypothetical protein